MGDAHPRNPASGDSIKRGLLLVLCLNLSAAASEPEPKVGERLPRRGDEIIVCGQLYHTTTKVVTWMDPGGYDAYRVVRRFAPDDPAEARAKATANSNSNASERGSARYNQRTRGLTREQLDRVHADGWDLPLLQRAVNQFVIHFDVCGTSRRCFEVLQDRRGLSVHFMLDIDGTIYQTLDLKERAWHATIANDRSIGIEVANMGAYRLKEPTRWAKWYQPDSEGRVRLVIPGTAKAGDPSPPSRPDSGRAGADKVVGPIHGGSLVQYDFTPQQYEALAKLTATLCTVFPQIRCDYPRDDKGMLIMRQLPARPVQQLPRRPRALPRAGQQGQPGPGVPVGPGDRRRAAAHDAAVIDVECRSRSGRTQRRRPGPSMTEGPGLVSCTRVMRGRESHPLAPTLARVWAFLTISSWKREGTFWYLRNSMLKLPLPWVMLRRSFE